MHIYNSKISFTIVKTRDAIGHNRSRDSRSQGHHYPIKQGQYVTADKQMRGVFLQDRATRRQKRRSSSLTYRKQEKLTRDKGPFNTPDLPIRCFSRPL